MIGREPHSVRNNHSVNDIPSGHSTGLETIRFGVMWYWIPALLAICALIIYITGTNHTLFILINRLYRFTGDQLWSNLSALADTLVVLVLFLPFCGRRPDILRALLIAAIFSTLWVHVLKIALGVPRPAAVLQLADIHVIGPVLRMGSFPSGHTTTAFTAAVLCGLMIRSHTLLTMLIMVATLAGLSRIVVGAHWPLDVLAGAFGGWLAAMAGIRLAVYWRGGCSLVSQRIIALFLLLCAGVLVTGYDTHYPDSEWLSYLIGITCPLLAIPGLMGLWHGRIT